MSWLTHWPKAKHATKHGVEQPEARVVKAHGDIIVLKVPGFKYSFSAHPTMDGYGYAPAEFQVYRVLEEKDKDGQGFNLRITLRVEEITRFPVR